jgi:hypothetical protein
MGRSRGRRPHALVVVTSALAIAACTDAYKAEEEPIALPTRDAPVEDPASPTEPPVTEPPPGPCTGAASETIPCDGKNACTGQKTRTCKGGMWGSFGACSGATGACTPGATRNLGCGCNGQQQQTCATSCTWTNSGTCAGQSCPSGHLCNGSSCCNHSCSGLTCGATNGCGTVCHAGSGCTIPCSNECTPGTYRCLNEDIWQECGNFDGDSCVEWGGGGSCYAQDKACSMGICFT